MIFAVASFFLVVTVQFIIFVIHAFAVGEMRGLFIYLKRGMLIGLPFGILTDLLFGHGLGLWNYALGYTWWFLTINGIFSYGFMVANVFLLQHHSLIHMYLWSIGLAVTYEITNYLLPVWEWTFATSPFVEYVAVIFGLYAGLTAVLIVIMKIVYKFHFKLLF